MCMCNTHNYVVVVYLSCFVHTSVHVHVHVRLYMHVLYMYVLVNACMHECAQCAAYTNHWFSHMCKYSSVTVMFMQLYAYYTVLPPTKLLE